jgi:hypothetical protein
MFVYATQLHSTTTSSSSIATEVIGSEGTESFRLSFKDTSASKTISPWHEISMKNDDGSYNMVRKTTFLYIDYVCRFVPSHMYLNLQTI